MDYKVVVSDPKSGRSYQLEVKDEQAKKIRGKKISETFEGAVLGLPGYKLEITGGSDKGGFAMKKGVHSQSAMKILMDKGVGYKAKSGSRARRRVHGEVLGDDVVQVNTKVVDYGGKSIESLLGLDNKEQEKAEGEEDKQEKGGG